MSLDARAKAFASNLAGGDVDGTFGRRSLSWGHHCGTPPHYIGFSRRKPCPNLGQATMCHWHCNLIGGFISREPTRLVALSATSMAMGVCGRVVAWHRRGEFDGVAKLMWWHSKLWRRPWVAACLSGWLLVADQGGWCFLAAIRSAWDFIGRRRSQQR